MALLAGQQNSNGPDKAQPSNSRLPPAQNTDHRALLLERPGAPFSQTRIHVTLRSAIWGQGQDASPIPRASLRLAPPPPPLSRILVELRGQKVRVRESAQVQQLHVSTRRMQGSVLCYMLPTGYAHYTLCTTCYVLHTIGFHTKQQHQIKFEGFPCLATPP